MFPVAIAAALLSVKALISRPAIPVFRSCAGLNANCADEALLFEAHLLNLHLHNASLGPAASIRTY